MTKRNRIPTICGAVVALAFATLATGCSSPTTPPVRFVVVDGSTRQPLAGVAVRQQSLQPNVIGRSIDRRYEYGPTGPDGQIVTRGVPLDFENIFMFSRPEYSQSEALVVGQGTMVDVIAP